MFNGGVSSCGAVRVEGAFRFSLHAGTLFRVINYCVQFFQFLELPIVMSKWNFENFIKSFVCVGPTSKFIIQFDSMTNFSIFQRSFTELVFYSFFNKL